MRRAAWWLAMGVLALHAAPAVAQAPDAATLPDAPPWRCNGFVRAFARDLEHGTFVGLDPVRFELLADHVSVMPHDDGFLLSSARARSVAYVIVERRTRRAVSSGDVVLECPPPAQATTLPPLFTSTSASTGGVRVQPHDVAHDLALVLEYLGFGVVAASVIAIVGVTIFSFIFDPHPVYFGCGIASGIGALVGVTGLVVDATAEPRSSASTAAGTLTLRF